MERSRPSGNPGVYYIALLIVLFGGCIGLALIAGAAALIALPPIIMAVAYLLKTWLGEAEGDDLPPVIDVEPALELAAPEPEQETEDA